MKQGIRRKFCEEMKTKYCVGHKEDFQHADVVFDQIGIYHMCGCIGLMGIIGVKVGAKHLWEAGQLILSMGLVWTEGKGYFLCLLPHTGCCTLYVLEICYLCFSYFSPLQDKSKPLNGDSKHAFILGPVARQFLQENISFRSVGDRVANHCPPSGKQMVDPLDQ